MQCQESTHALGFAEGSCVVVYLISHMLADEKVSSTIVDNYVKLFFSSCAQLDHKITEEVPSALDKKIERKQNASTVKKSKVPKKGEKDESNKALTINKKKDNPSISNDESHHKKSNIIKNGEKDN